MPHEESKRRIATIQINWILSLTAFVLFSCNNTQYAKCISVHDADTVTLLLRNGDKMKVRLAECDANELDQPFGYEAKEFTENHLLNRTIEIKQVAIDKYKRHVCKVYINGQYFDKELVLAGWAVVYRKYASYDMYNAELEAKNKGVGIWSQEEIMPFKWRKIHHK